MSTNLFDIFPTDDDNDDLDLELGCRWCLGCFIPAGSHDILGPVYQTCPHCSETCPCCRGKALFPADTTCNYCLTDALAEYGLRPVFCHTCNGVTNFTIAPEVTE